MEKVIKQIDTAKLTRLNVVIKDFYYDKSCIAVQQDESEIYFRIDRLPALILALQEIQKEVENG